MFKNILTTNNNKGVFMNEIVWVLINSSVSFLYLFLISKLLGKKQIAQLQFFDYTVGISLGSISAEMATADDPFYHYLIAMPIFFVLGILIDNIGKSMAYKKIKDNVKKRIKFYCIGNI